MRVKHLAELEKAENYLKEALAAAAEHRALLREVEAKLMASEKSRKAAENTNHAEALEKMEVDFDAYKNKAHWIEADLRRQMEESEANLRRQMEESEADIRRQMEESEQRLDASRERLAKSEERLEEAQARIKAHEERIEESEAQLVQSDVRHEEMQGELAQSREEVERLRAELEESEAILADQNGSHAKLRADLDARLAGGGSSSTHKPHGVKKPASPPTPFETLAFILFQFDPACHNGLTDGLPVGIICIHHTAHVCSSVIRAAAFSY